MDMNNITVRMYLGKRRQCSTLNIALFTLCTKQMSAKALNTHPLLQNEYEDAAKVQDCFGFGCRAQLFCPPETVFIQKHTIHESRLQHRMWIEPMCGVGVLRAYRRILATRIT